jgi:hypothetical protein
LDVATKRQSLSKAQRKALAAHRRRRREKGVVRVEVQVPAIDAGIVRDVAAILRGEPAQAQAVRAQLRSVAAGARHGASVFDIFGSDLPDRNFEGVFVHDRRAGKTRDVEL